MIHIKKKYKKNPETTHDKLENKALRVCASE